MFLRHAGSPPCSGCSGHFGAQEAPGCCSRYFPVAICSIGRPGAVLGRPLRYVGGVFGALMPVVVPGWCAVFFPPLWNLSSSSWMKRIASLGAWRAAEAPGGGGGQARTRRCLHPRHVALCHIFGAPISDAESPPCAAPSCPRLILCMSGGQQRRADDADAAGAAATRGPVLSAVRPMGTNDGRAKAPSPQPAAEPRGMFFCAYFLCARGFPA